MHKVVSGNLKRVVYAHLEPEEDLYDAILEIAESEDIDTGLVMDITGGLSRVRMAMPLGEGPVDAPPGIIEMEGLTEATGSGIVGRNIDSWSSDKAGVYYNAGEPYLHVHMSVTTAGRTVTGHLIEGCKVRSVIPESHFTIVMAEVEGVELELRTSEGTTEHYPGGIPYHVLREAGA